MNFKPELFLNDLKIALRSLARAKGLAITVVLTLALGIGANAAIFTLVRGVLLRPLVNRDEDRLVYIRQSAPGIGTANTYFSVPELSDLESSVKTLSEFRRLLDHRLLHGRAGRAARGPRRGCRAASYFDVMGLHPVLGRLLGPQDDGPKAAGAVVLTYRFWSYRASRAIRRVHRQDGSPGQRPHGDAIGTIIGVLEPCIPYPAETEIIANVVTSPHHLSATMVTGRVHRMTELFGRLAPGATVEQARAELRTVYGAMVSEHPEAYPKQGRFADQCRHCCATRSRPARAPCCWCCSLPRGWSSSSPVRMSPT